MTFHYEDKIVTSPEFTAAYGALRSLVARIMNDTNESVSITYSNGTLDIRSLPK